jgi:hypothetical protein
MKIKIKIPSWLESKPRKIYKKQKNQLKESKSNIINYKVLFYSLCFGLAAGIIGYSLTRILITGVAEFLFVGFYIYLHYHNE